MDLSTPRSGKRTRSESTSSSEISLNSDLEGSEGSASPSRPDSPVAGPYSKILRSSDDPAASSSGSLECHLPPTCFPESRTFDNPAELERHQLAFHTYICRTLVRDRTGSTSRDAGREAVGSSEGVWDLPREFTSRHGGERWKECRKVFPDQRLLDLHQIETHDPVSRQKQRDGLSVFQCFVPPPECTRTFINPKHRRLHLIYKHQYPKQYFFSITNHGLNKIAAEEGLGASLIRPRKEFPPSPPKVDDTASVHPHDSGNAVVDVDMDDLTKGMSKLESSLSFVPTQLRRKGKGKAKAAPNVSVNPCAIDTT